MGSFDFNPRAPFISGATPGSEWIEVWLNGYREPLAIAADPVDGWVERYRSDKDGHILQCLSEAATERVYGRVDLRQTRF